jgi:hypothetical protein
VSGAGSAVPGAGTAAPALPSSPWAVFFVASIAVFAGRTRRGGFPQHAIHASHLIDVLAGR